METQAVSEVLYSNILNTGSSENVTNIELWLIYSELLHLTGHLALESADRSMVSPYSSVVILITIKERGNSMAQSAGSNARQAAR